MQLNLFSIPIWIGNIDSNQINLSHDKPEKSWEHCTALSTIDLKNTLDEQSANYILKTIVNLIKPYFKVNFKVRILNIWINEYINEDHQEAHIHTKSSLSFIIYKKVDKSQTVFNHPNRHFIHYSEMQEFFESSFVPECRQDQIIIFPSYLEHFVKKNSNSCTIAGNLQVIKSN